MAHTPSMQEPERQPAGVTRAASRTAFPAARQVCLGWPSGWAKIFAAAGPRNGGCPPAVWPAQMLRWAGASFMRGSSNYELRRTPAAIERWYAANSRDLPWRQPGATPWSILVSEVMLQQTPVSRGAAWRIRPGWDRWPQACRPGGRNSGRRPSGNGSGWATRAARCGCMPASELMDPRARRPGAGIDRRSCCATCRVLGFLHRGCRRQPSCSVNGTRCWTPMSGGCLPGCWPGQELPLSGADRRGV